MQDLPRRIPLFSLIIQGITCIIGSGWLFGSYYAAKVAGPGAIFSWIIGGIITIAIASTMVSVATRYPKSGGIIHFVQYTHGAMCGFILGWASWLVYASAITGEAIASTQYLSSWNFTWTHNLFNSASGTLSTTGIIFAIALILIYFFLNYWTIKLFLRSVNAITILKIAIPLITILLLIGAHFDTTNFVAVNHSVIPYGWSAVFSAVTSCGIIYSFNGFQVIVSLAGEAKNPKRNLAIAVFVAIGFCLLLYLALQIVFIGNIQPNQFTAGWAQLNMSSPYVQLAMAVNLNFITLLLYFDAFVSPSGAALSNFAASARMIFGLQHYGHFPKYFGKTDSKHAIPRRALTACLIASIGFLLVAHDWSKLASIISVLMIISYMAGPISAGCIDRLLSKKYGFSYIDLLAPVTFIFISLLFYWAQWPRTGQVSALIFSGLIVYIYSHYQHQKYRDPKDIYSGIWLLVYLATMSTISYLGSKQFGGIGIIPNYIDQLIVVMTGAFFYSWALKSSWKTPALSQVSADRHIIYTLALRKPDTLPIPVVQEIKNNVLRR